MKKDHIRRGEVGVWKELFTKKAEAAFDEKDEAHFAAAWAYAVGQE